MLASNLSIFDVLDFQPDNGLVKLGKRRVIIFDGDILMELRRMIVESMGWPMAQPAVFSYGYQVGRRDAEILKQKYDWKDQESLFLAGVSMQTQRGYCKTIINHYSSEPEKEQLNIRGRWYNSFEVDSHKLLKLTNFGPVCFVLSGYLSGVATVCFNQEVLFQEMSCFNRQHCSFEGKYLEQWGEEGMIFMKGVQNFNLYKKFASLDKEMLALRNKIIVNNSVVTIHANVCWNITFFCFANKWVNQKAIANFL